MNQEDRIPAWRNVPETLVKLPDKVAQGSIEYMNDVARTAIMAIGAFVIFIVLLFVYAERHDKHKSQLHSWLGKQS